MGEAILIKEHVESPYQGYGTCNTNENTSLKIVALDNSYVLSAGSLISIKFNNTVHANASMNVNATGEKPIYYRGTAIIEGVINAGDTATFMYDGKFYHLVSLDTSGGVSIGDEPPMNTSLLWIDTTGGIAIAKYYDKATSTWKPTKAVWG